MHDDDPLYIRILDTLGVNTTRLRWKLYQKEEQIKQIAKTGVRPARFQWLSYPHKICAKCSALNDKEAKSCHACEAPLPSMLGYRIHRALSGSASGDAPLVTQAFLGLILFCFAIQIALDGFSFDQLMSPNPMNALRLGTFNTLIYLGPEQCFRWMAFALLHGGLLHVGFNVYALYNLCPLIEAQVGRVRMLTLITLTQLGTALACYLWYFELRNMHWVSVVGASGWIFGVMGYSIVTYHRIGGVGHHIRNQLLRWCMMCLVIGFIIPGISNTGHIGGLLSGIAVALLPIGGNIRKPWIEKAWNLAGGLSALLWMLTLVAMAYSVVYGDYEAMFIDAGLIDEIPLDSDTF